MRRNALDPSAIPPVPARSDAEYVKAHLYETHDIWHVVTGFGADVNGELGLQAFYLAQLPSVHAAVLLAAGLVRMVLYDFDAYEARLEAIARGWLLGRRAQPLFGVMWGDLWTEPLTSIRALLHLDVDDIDRSIVA